MIKISKRLETIASLVPINSSVIDVGCDHGLLDIYLYQKNICKKIIASDININALNNAKENIKKYKLSKYIETRLGSGLDALFSNDKIDTIIISGMGAHTIIDILKNDYNIKNINEKVYSHTFNNGLKLNFIKKEGFKSFYVGLLVKFGSIVTKFTDGSRVQTIPTGVAHFLEHLFFKKFLFQFFFLHTI